MVTDADVPGSAARAELATRARLVVLRLARRLRRTADGGLTATQLSALATIESRGPLRLGDLGIHEGIAPPTVSRLVDHLEGAGLVRRQTDARDGRSFLVGLTPEGEALLADLRSTGTHLLETAMASLGEEEQRLLIQAIPVLERLLDALGEGAPPGA
ncbi:MAG TPA: MarR family transcriptional regulator [Candidatus Dormibacteraeota bacterium]|jgi:DNA-binding MarR family transcriptional regulator|nr:MarR family transcriptional regulator [Candidatus Dormibacteraeota bacterium]